MDIWLTVVLVVHVICALGIIGLVLLQHGKGADMGAAFGSGSSGSLFGATGSANFLSRTTAVLAAIFFVTSLSLAYLATHRPRAVESGGVMDAAPPASAPAGDPSVPTPGAANNGKPEAPAPAQPDGEKPKANEVPK
jgi:preprotein translocase subunit SecG